MSRGLWRCIIVAFGLIASACGGASTPPERSAVLLTIVAPDTVSNSANPLDGRHLVITPVDLEAEPAQRIYVHLPQRGTTPVAADPVWGAMANAGARVVVLAYNPTEPVDGFDPRQSAETQLAGLIGHLADTAPADGWDSFGSDGTVDWSRVIISGNRDGADVALAIADTHDVARTVLLSGPTTAPAVQPIDPSRFAFGHADDQPDVQPAIWTAAGVDEATTTLTSDADLNEITTGNRFVSELALVDGFNERNDWQNRRYIALWQYLCCS